MEIADYLAVHPEYDVKKKQEKAEMVLRRAQAGEDFSKSEFSFHFLPLINSNKSDYLFG